MPPFAPRTSGGSYSSRSQLARVLDLAVGSLELLGAPDAETVVKLAKGISAKP